jgi:hypothetical protein
MITRERVRELFDYSGDSGEFVRRIKVQGCRKLGTPVGADNGSGYLKIRADGKDYYAHRLAWLYVYGYMPNCEIDHIDGKRSNNRIDNLREAPGSLNGKNKAVRSDNSTGLHGVSWHKAGRKWEARITTEGRKKHLGLFEDFFEACCVRKSAENLYGFHPNHGRTV